MVFTENEKAFINILYLIIAYGLHWLMKEFHGKGQKKVWIGQSYQEPA